MKFSEMSAEFYSAQKYEFCIEYSLFMWLVGHLCLFMSVTMDSGMFWSGDSAESSDVGTSMNMLFVISTVEYIDPEIQKDN